MWTDANCTAGCTSQEAVSLSEYFDKILSLWKYTKKGKRKVVPALIIMIIGSLIFATIPMIAKNYVDNLSSASGGYDLTVTDLDIAIFALVGLVLAWYVLYTFGRSAIIDDVSGKIMRDEIAQKTNRISVATLEERQSGDAAAIMANDVPEVVKAMHTEIPNFFVQLAVLIFTVVMMFILNVYLALIYFVLLIVTYHITRRIGNGMHRSMQTKQESMGRLNGYFNDAITSHSLVKIYGLEDKVLANFHNIDEEHKGSYVRTTSVFGYIEPLSRIVDNAGYFITAVLGVIMILDGAITFGTFLAFISYSTIIGKPLASFTGSINKIQSAMVSYDRILDYLDITELPDESAYEDIDPDSVTGDIEFRDVSFTYPDGTVALRDINFRIGAGTIVTIIGEEGSGKSTVSDLIMGFRSATEGQVLLSGRDISDIKRSKLRSVIGMSSQNPVIFEGTVYYNLSQTETDEEIERISKLTGLDETVRALPKGYNTVIGGRGRGLSSGEKQLLSITRLMIYNRKVMIFDESTSEMDPLTSNNAFTSIRENLKGKTVIIVDNTPVSVRYADTVIFMGKGKVLDIGTHEELMDRNPAYTEMYRNMTV